MDYSRTPIIELARVIAEHLQNQGIEVVLVGGLAVEIYTENLYLTKDIDMVNTNYKSPRELNGAMAELGFYKKGRIYVNATTDITVEFPAGPLSVGDDLITTITAAKVTAGEIPILQAIDVIRDRLAAYIHWRDRQSLVQALAILLKHPIKIASLKPFCDREGGITLYPMLNTLYKKAMLQKLTCMEGLELLVADYFMSVL
ncbi:MAG: hypothetical protein RL497_1676 [Pseudomonadota bacterium]|jgi:hypothetical protein